MKRIACLTAVTAVLGCGNPSGSGEVRPAPVLWMEWPATVPIGQSFEIRAVISPLCDHGELVARVARKDGAVMLDARYTDVRPAEWGCEPAGPIYGLAVISAAGLAGPPGGLDLLGSGYPLDSLRRFGTLTAAVASAADSTRAAGYAFFMTDTVCPVLVPGGHDPIGLRYRFDGLAPRNGYPRYWVEGYVTAGPPPVDARCGDGPVFHVTAYGDAT